MADSINADLIVLGGGMGGTTAAYAAALAGKAVILVEKAPALGGSALLSGTHIWTARSFDQLREKAPTGDPDLQRAFIDNFPRLTEFVRATGVEMSEDVDVLFGRGNRFDVVAFLQKASSAIRAAGGIVAVSTETSSLIVEDDRVVGARVRDRQGMSELRAPALVLATGGFQGSKHLLTTYLGDATARLMHRSNPTSTGDGLRLGLEAGAAIAGDMRTFYGHLIASPVPEFTPGDFVRYALVYSDRCLLANIEGVRFAEEWLGDHRNAQRVAEQPQGRAVMIFDERVRRESSRAAVVKGTEAYDTFGDPAAVGARTATAPALDELGRAVQDWGYAQLDLARLVAEHATAASRAGVDASVAEAPFYAIETRPGITFTQGGLRIDASARVLDEAGRPIPGLYAAGADTGHVFDGGYAGGLALAGTFGLLAVDDVLGRSA
jgi:succinate dehydrogenase/fumarate reductase flavoprotein subunit